MLCTTVWYKFGVGASVCATPLNCKLCPWGQRDPPGCMGQKITNLWRKFFVTHNFKKAHCFHTLTSQPGQHPDPNHIENVWWWMKMKLHESNPTNLDQLKEEIKRLWFLRMEDSQILKSLLRACLRGFWRPLRGVGTLPTTENVSTVLCSVVWPPYKKHTFFS